MNTRNVVSTLLVAAMTAHCAPPAEVPEPEAVPASPGGVPTPAAGTKADGTGEDATAIEPALSCPAVGDVCEAGPSGAAAYRLYREALRRKGALDVADVRRLAAWMRGDADGPGSVRAFLQAVLTHPGTPFAGEARWALEAALAGRAPDAVPAENALYALSTGTRPNSVVDDGIRFLGTGTARGATSASSHSRGYAKKAEGILRFPHGSPAPARPGVDSAEETHRLRTQGPSAALDRAAAVAGLSLGQFGFVHRGQARFYDPRARYWEGLCHAWSYGALDERVNALVDVPGEEGARGLWIFGEWLSRADLGNWMMAVSDQLSVADTELVDPYVTPLDWLLGVTQWVMSGGPGLRADLFNDTERQASEIWNQPVVEASLTVSEVDAAAAEAVLAFAARDATTARLLPAEPAVRLVELSALWGAEVADAHEDEPALAESVWRIYFVVDTDGRAVAGFMAHHLAAANVAGLPATESDPLPDYFAYPKNEVLDAAFHERPSRLLQGALDGQVFRFYVGTVLAHGVPEPLRAAFEAELLARGGGADLDAAALEALASRYPGVANAYSPEQWRRVFEPALGPGEAWGARWGQFREPL